MCGSGKSKRVTVSIHFPHGQECRPLQMWGGNGSRQWWIRGGVKAACGRRAIALGAPPAWSAASGRRHVLVVSFAWFICCESSCWRMREWGCCSRTPPPTPPTPTLIQFILLSSHWQAGRRSCTLFMTNGAQRNATGSILYLHAHV